MSGTIYFIDHSVSIEFAKREIKESEELFFQDLAAAYQHGYCYLCGDLESLTCLCELQSGLTRNIFKTVLSRYVESGVAMETVQQTFVLTYRSKLELLPDILQEEGRHCFIDIPTAIDANWRLYTECCLLTENLDDGKFYLLMAKHYCKEKGIPLDRICFHQEPGGGHTTYQVLEKCILQDKCPTLCLVDSDRKHGPTETYPNCPAIGETLRQVQNVSKKLSEQDDVPPHCLHGIHVHEVENLIPFQILEELEQERHLNMRKGLERVAQLKKIRDGKPVLYYDFKEGFSYLKEGPQRDYWKEILLELGGAEELMPSTRKPKDKGHPEELFFPPLNSNILKYAFAKFEDAEKKKPIAIDTYLKKDWDNIGLQMLTWGYVYGPSRA